MNRPRALTLAAGAAVLLLAAALGARLALHARPASPPTMPAKIARFTGTVPAAHVAAPATPGLLRVPCWGCPEADRWKIHFQTDLDLLAPLGDGPGNAALWLKDFEKQVGARASEASEAMARRVEGPGDWGKVLPPDDPLLAEAEPWADQAVLRFYPDVFAVEGFETRIPNLLLSLAIGKSWAARAMARPEAPGALDDCRRAVRWGRLLRQDDATVIQDLIGLACIRLGAQGIYDLAVRRGDQPLAFAAAIVLGEHAPQRLKTAALITRVDAAAGTGITDAKLDDILSVAGGPLDRRFRAEAITQLAVVRTLGSRAQKEKAEKVLDQLGAAEDPVLGTLARWSRRADLTKDQIAHFHTPPG